jgi:dTDP-4-dehydrorhamnose reductase
MNKKIMFIGADGLVGTKAVEVMRDNNVIVFTPDQNELDITRLNQVEAAIAATSSKSIVLAAAYTDVDGAERNPDIANKINVQGAENVFRAAKKHDKFLIYISTDFVFPATVENPGPYSEETPTAKPDSDEIGEYAKTKTLAERILSESGVRHAIVRIAFPFGNPGSGRDLVRKILFALESGYGLFEDQQYTPTYIPDLADALTKICTQELEGTFHICCQPPVSPYELGKFIAKEQNLDIKVKKGSFVDYMSAHPDKAPRPKLGGFIDEMTNLKLERQSPQWKEAVSKTLREL